MLIPLGFLASAGGAAASDFVLLETALVGSGGQASVTFSNLATLASGYKHLQIRMVSRQSLNANGHGQVYVQFNGDTAANYSWHQLIGSGSTVTSGAGVSTTFALGGFSPFAQETGFISSVIDILDPFVTTKNKTIRALSGGSTVLNNTIGLTSGAWRNTNAVTSITIDSFDTWAEFSRFSLYGVK